MPLVGSLWHKIAGEAIPRSNPRHRGGPLWCNLPDNETSVVWPSTRKDRRRCLTGVSRLTGIWVNWEGSHSTIAGCCAIGGDLATRVSTGYSLGRGSWRSLPPCDVVVDGVVGDRRDVRGVVAVLTNGNDLRGGAGTRDELVLLNHVHELPVFHRDLGEGVAVDESRVHQNVVPRDPGLIRTVSIEMVLTASASVLMSTVPHGEPGGAGLPQGDEALVGAAFPAAPGLGMVTGERIAWGL